MMTAAIEGPFDERYFSTVFLVREDPASKWSRFAIVTACNPRGEVHALSFNCHQHEKLKATLSERALNGCEVIGCAPDGDHAEQGYAIECDAAIARDLCREYAQLAFYMVEDDQIFLHSAASEQSQRVSSWSKRRRIKEIGSQYEL